MMKVVAVVVVAVVDRNVSLPPALPAFLLFFWLLFPAKLRPSVKPELVVGHELSHDQSKVNIVANLREIGIKRRIF